MNDFQLITINLSINEFESLGYIRCKIESATANLWNAHDFAWCWGRINKLREC
jgi:hypothetical protein